MPMRAPSDKRSTDKRIDDEAALEEARCRLRPLFLDIVSWNEPSTENVEKKFRHAIGTVECVLDEAVGVITAIMKFAELAPSKDLHNLSGRAAGAISFIEIARKAAWPVIKSGRPAKECISRSGDCTNRTVDQETVRANSRAGQLGRLGGA
jgi:hypothetical protein